jgi:1,4-alpha-glucan branching enzyme
VRAGDREPPQTASRIADLEYTWRDEAWLQQRAARQAMSAPMAVYELHLGSWQRGTSTESSCRTARWRRG